MFLRIAWLSDTDTTDVSLKGTYPSLQYLSESTILNVPSDSVTAGHRHHGRFAKGYLSESTIPIRVYDTERSFG